MLRVVSKVTTLEPMKLVIASSFTELFNLQPFTGNVAAPLSLRGLNDGKDGDRLNEICRLNLLLGVPSVEFNQEMS